MLVILRKDVQNLGKEGDVVKVSDGYARNMLIPKGFAKLADEKNIKSLAKQKAKIEAKKQSDLDNARELADKMKSYKVKIMSKSGDGGRLFGSITSQDIADALKEQYGLNIDKRKILLDSHIKEAGIHKVDIKVYPDVIATIIVNVEV